MEKLFKEISCQRKLLQPSELEIFDNQWGFDNSGEFIISNQLTNNISLLPCMKQKVRGTYDIIENQLKEVVEEVNKKSEKLKIAEDGHAGLEILHLFIKDLLGRSTPAALIFETKANEDFKHTEVVTRTAKRLAMLALAGINIFFVYYAILTGFRRGVSWQQSYLIACIIQFMVEIVLNETMECVWIQCIIPMLVRDDVRRVGDSITEIISDLCSNTPKESRLFLNAPDYLFVSTNLAKKFPTLMESIVVQSYFSHVPGELSKLWNVGSVARIRRYHNLRHITLLSTILGSLQYFGTLPFMLHRLFIRFVQPFVFGGLVLLWKIIMSSPIYVALMSFMLTIVVAFCVYKYIYGVASSNNLTPITPIIDEGVQELSCENHLKTDSVNDDDSDYCDYGDNPIVITVDMNDFQPIKDDKGSDSESDSSNDHFDTIKDKDSDNIDHDKDKSKSDNSTGSCYISDSSSLSVFDHSSICISEEDIDTISDIIQDSTETDEDDVETEFDISISSSDSEDSCAFIMSNLMEK